MNADTESLEQLLNRARAQLHALPDAAAESGRLLAFLLGHSRAWVLAHVDTAAEPTLAANFAALVERRRRGEPFAYITGAREFWSLPLRVNPAVLIPRPETELVVERALALCSASSASVADLGTGSGAIALACARERPQWQITATDISAAALMVAQANAAALALTQLQFRCGSWFEPLAGRRFDLVLSNPPYVAAGDPALADPGLQHEPASALVAGPDGLAALRLIIAAAPAGLHAGGWLVLEHGADQGAAVASLLVEAGLRHVRCHPDLAGHPRVTEAQRT